MEGEKVYKDDDNDSLWEKLQKFSRLLKINNLLYDLPTCFVKDNLVLCKISITKFLYIFV